MDLNNLTTNDQKELLLLHILKSNLEIVENTLSKKQETLEFKMNTPTKDFQFDEPLFLSGDWMMGVTNLEVYNTVYNINETNNKFEIYKSGLQGFEPITKHINEKGELYIRKDEKSIEIEKQIHQNKNICDDVSTNYVEKMNEVKPKINKHVNYDKYNEFYNLLNVCTRNDFLELTSITIPPGIYEFNELNDCIQRIIQKNNESFKLIEKTIEPIKFEIVADPINMHCTLTTNHKILFNSKLNEVLGFENKFYDPGQHISEKVINIMPINKIHLKCNTIDGSIVNGIRQPILFSFSLDKAPGFKIYKEPKLILYKKLNTDKLSHIKFYLEDDNRNEVSFQGETLTFTIQLIKI